MQRGPDPDVDSIDATIRSGVPRREAIDVQLKRRPPRREGGWTPLSSEAEKLQRSGEPPSRTLATCRLELPGRGIGVGGLNTLAADHQEVRLVALAQRAGPDGCGIQDHRDTFFTAHRRLGARTAIRAGQGGISMNGLTNEVTLARTVGLRAVHAYLRTNGWVRADSACRTRPMSTCGRRTIGRPRSSRLGGVCRFRHPDLPDRGTDRPDRRAKEVGCTRRSLDRRVGYRARAPRQCARRQHRPPH